MRYKSNVFVKAQWKNNEVKFSALCDSGNLMRDPILGDPVIAVSHEVIAELCGKDLAESLLSLDTQSLQSKGITVRVIPHRTANHNEIICGFIPDKVTVVAKSRKNTVKCILAPKRCPKNYFAGYAATIPSCLMP